MKDYYIYRAQVERVIDGDTVKVYIDQGFEDYTMKVIRLAGVDTSETHNTAHDSDEYKLGKEQERFVRDFLTSDDEWPLSVRTYEEGKYGGRWIGDIWNGSECLSDALIEEWPEVEEDY